MASTIKQYGVSYMSERRPYPTKTEHFDTLAEALGEVARLAKTNAPKLISPDRQLLEYHATSGGLVLMLLAHDGHYFTEVWRNASGHRFVEQISLHTNKRLATSQLMSIFAGLCAAERANNEMRAAA